MKNRQKKLLKTILYRTHVIKLLILVLLLSMSISCTETNTLRSLHALEISSEEPITGYSDQLVKLCETFQLPVSSVYHWKNRLLLLSSESIPDALPAEIQAKYPGLQVKIFSDPFYVFDRSLCKGEGMAEEWDHVLLTANVVADSALQEEYMAHHATQHEKWPEIIHGFCKADFQQLLMFKNGRQLLLIISLPKGKTLEELDPETTRNNPRVTEWNRLMKKYQEGIEGTAPGEVWVFYKPLL